jgi:hypothetical protein
MIGIIFIAAAIICGNIGFQNHLKSVKYGREAFQTTSDSNLPINMEKRDLANKAYFRRNQFYLGSVLSLAVGLILVIGAHRSIKKLNNDENKYV